MIFAFGFTVLIASAYAFLPELLARPFRPDGDPQGWAAVMERVPLLLKFVALYCLFDSLNMSFSFALRGAGDTRFVTAVAVGVSWPVMVLPAWLSWEYDLGLYWAWGFASLYIILALIFLARFLQGRWKSMCVIETPIEAAALPSVVLAESATGAAKPNLSLRV